MNPLVRILFVDDEPMVLDALRRSLRNLRSEWDMSFARSGADALALMEQRPFDVLVTDMRMPGMNGVELLQEVRNRHPETVRLVLSGQADEQMIFQCIGLAHQYLAKPCDPESLRAAIQRATRAGSALNNPRLRELLGRLEQLPSIPRLYHELGRKLEDPEADLNDVAQLIARDPAMTAKVLKLVNSAFFGLPHTVNDILEAVHYLGINTLKTLVLAVHAFDQYPAETIPWFPWETLWNHSLETGARARALAQLEDAPDTVLQQAAVAGLLHDLGQLILAVNLREDYAAIRRAAATGQRPLTESEQACLGTTHAEVAGYLLGLWGLPDPVVEAITFHHHPDMAGSVAFTPLTAVHVAETLRPGEWESPGTTPPGPDMEYLNKLGLAERVPLWQQELTACSAP